MELFFIIYNKNCIDCFELEMIETSVISLRVELGLVWLLLSEHLLVEPFSLLRKYLLSGPLSLPGVPSSLA